MPHEPATESSAADLALVLAGGGARAAYQVGVLAAIAERAGPDVRFPIVTGVSAGAINAGHVASSRGTLSDVAGSLSRAWLGLSTHKVFDPGLGALVAGTLRWTTMLGSAGTMAGSVNGLLDTRPLRATVSRYTRTDGIETNIAEGRLRALGISTTAYTTGETITFVHGAAGTPYASRRQKDFFVRHLLGVEPPRQYEITRPTG